MKRIILSILAVAALASCSKTESAYVDQDQEIKVNPVTAMTTKANVLAAIDGTEYPTAENFDVYAYWANYPAGNKFTTAEADYLTGTTTGVEFTNKGLYWGGTTTYYWPKNGSLRFAAYSPSSIDMTHTLSTDTYKVEGYVQPHNTAATWDLLVAPTSPSYTAETAAENVSVVFEHALSWITLQVKAKDAEAAKAFDIKKVTINKVCTTATLEAAMGDGIQYNEWKNHQQKYENYVVYTGSQAVTETATVIETVNQGTLVIPQNTTTVTIDYKQNALDGTPALDNQSVTVDLVLDTDNSPWEPGKHYIYTLIFGLDEILINPSVADWEDVEVGEIDTDKTVSNVSTPAQLKAAIAKGGKVVLQSDITVDETITVDKTVVLDLNGKTLTNKKDNTSTDVIVVSSTGELTINGEGTVEAVTGNDGYAVISDGLLIINNGTYKSGVDANGEANAVIYARGNGKVLVNGGTFPNNNNSTFVLNKKDQDRATTTIEVAGGTYTNFNPAENAAEGAGTNFVKAGYTVKVNEDGTYTVVPATDFAEVLAAGGVVTLYNDIVLDGTVNVSADLVLNLNGKTIKNKVENTSTDVFVVAAGKTLTINGEGTVEAVSGNDGYAVVADGNVVINGGTFKSGRDADGVSNAVIYARGNGTVTVNGGYFPNENNSGFVLNKKDANRATTVISVKGGKYVGFNPADNAAEGANTNFLAEGYKVETSGNVYTVVAE